MHDSSFGWRFVNNKMKDLYGTDAMGQTAENLVDKFGISREDQDQFSAWSQQKAAAAQKSGRLAEEIVAVEIPQRKKDPIVFSQDEFIRPGTTVESLAGLRPAFRREGGTVTAGNASGLNDGAAATIIASEDAVKKYNLKPLARIVSSAVVGVEPRIMGIGPVGATNLALKRAGLTLDDMDILEFNEAFAAIGHPLGVTGTRILHTAAIELQKTGKRYALAAMCVGVGQGYATIIENPNL